MTHSVLLPAATDADPVAFAGRAADLGYDTVWLGELWGRDAFVTLAEIAREVDVGLGTAIANVYSRTPAALAQAAASVEEAATGRVRLGLGTSTPKAITDLHGLDFEHPARRLHETAELAGRFLASEGPVSYDGECFRVRDFPGLETDVPVYVAALGSATRRATGRVADGWIPHNVPFDRLPDAFETIATAARERGRDPEAITVAPYVPSAVSDAPAAARDAVRGHLAYYVGSGEGYRRAVGAAFPEEASEIASAWRDGERDTAKAAVTDEMVAALGVAGDPAGAREQFAAVASNPVVDEPIVVVPSNAPGLAAETIEALAPSSQ